MRARGNRFAAVPYTRDFVIEGPVRMPSPWSFRRMPVVLLLVLLARCAAPDPVDCDLRVVAKMPLEVQDHLLIVPAAINGQWVHLIVDTGAERTTLSAAAAENLGLRHDDRFTRHVTGVGGGTTTADEAIDRLVLGGVHFPLGRLAVGNFRLQSERGLNADGLLGADILLAFDMDIDVPGNTLTLYHARQCPDGRPPWQQQAIEIPGVRARKDRLLVPFVLDGVDGTAILDTGAQGNVLGPAMASRLGLNSQTMAGDRTIRQHGIGPAEVTAHVHRFNQLRIGPVTRQPAVLAVMDTEAGTGDALIGEDFLFGRRVWLAFKGRQIFVSGIPRD
jgi:predicted aspartyl protease